MASVDPTEIHPEHDILTPENIDEWDESQIEAYREAKDAELTAEAEANRVDMAVEERDALEALKTATKPDEPLTETVSLGDAEVTVSKRLTGELEQTLDHINKNRDDLKGIKDSLIDAITLLIVDDNEDGKYDFSSRAVWEAFYYDEGTEGLAEVFDLVSDPALTRRERLQKFRDERQRGQRGGTDGHHG